MVLILSFQFLERVPEDSFKSSEESSDDSNNQGGIFIKSVESQEKHLRPPTNLWDSIRIFDLALKERLRYVLNL